jgi:hypothetical protein
MDRDQQLVALQALRDARKWVEHAHDEAEAEHDEPGEMYMDYGLYEIMKETEALLDRIDGVLKESEES